VALVTGPDQTSLSYQSDGARRAESTIRIARDATGAPPLGEHYVALGAVYQFTPLGWREQFMEVRLPLSAQAQQYNSAPILLIALPSGPWMQVEA
jgi:hypothetical protein